MKYFAQNIRYIRKANGLTQKEMADKLDKAPTSVASWEQGVRTPNVRDTMQVCRVFGVELDDLLDTDLSLSYKPTNSNINEIITLYRKLDSTQQEIVYNLIKSMVK